MSGGAGLGPAQLMPEPVGSQHTPRPALDPYSGGLLLTVQRCARPHCRPGLHKPRRGVWQSQPPFMQRGRCGAFEPLCVGCGRREGAGGGRGAVAGWRTPQSCHHRLSLRLRHQQVRWATLSPNGAGARAAKRNRGKGAPYAWDRARSAAASGAAASGERRAASAHPAERRRLWSPRQPASPAASPQPSWRRGLRVSTAGLPAHGCARSQGLPHTFREPCRPAGDPAPLPHRLHLPSCPKQLGHWEAAAPPLLASLFLPSL